MACAGFRQWHLPLSLAHARAHVRLGASELAVSRERKCVCSHSFCVPRLAPTGVPVGREDWCASLLGGNDEAIHCAAGVMCSTIQYQSSLVICVRRRGQRFTRSSHTASPSCLPRLGATASSRSYSTVLHSTYSTCTREVRGPAGGATGQGPYHVCRRARDLDIVGTAAFWAAVHYFGPPGDGTVDITHYAGVVSCPRGRLCPILRERRWGRSVPSSWVDRVHTHVRELHAHR